MLVVPWASILLIIHQLTSLKKRFGPPDLRATVRDANVALLRQRWPAELCDSYISYKIMTGLGRTTEINLPSDGKPDRFYVIHEPLFLRKIREQKRRIPLLIYFHGKQGTAWDSAIDETNWRTLSNEQEFIVVYGQAAGAIFEHGVKVPKDDIALSTAFWKSVCPDEDLNYLTKVYEDVSQHVLPDVIDRSRVYFVGFSSGGLFSYNVAVAMSCRPFAAICNYMGGVQYDMRDTNSILNAQDAKLRCPVYLLTGTSDSHLEHCRKAKEYLEKANFSVKLEVMEGKKHLYYKELVEKPMWNFLKQYRLSDEADSSRSWKDSAEIIQETFSTSSSSSAASRPISPPPVMRARSPPPPQGTLSSSLPPHPSQPSDEKKN